ncbi:ankyrin repeat domain-containing protein [Wolbachia endosymbiont of Folsomia candida]|uniref:ankyrin repeat domain-containing protein n=1 Tax=Wolbachia endosymbiont of Folsomia candida TaxID=169402 RepID=UPI000D78B943|nr:ankyrin repeat domain-containing protein [Wolbachia endosymbiont of Folsomia candida]AWW50881.1 ankyrin repeat domain-containing protein [Wolbachia endosymbiont of Folsomia candida]
MGTSISSEYIKHKLIYLEIIKCLINQSEVDINAQGIGGKTPLHCAIELDELSLVELLLTKKNINPLIEDNEGKTSLDYARNVVKKEVLKALINNKYGSEQDSLLHLAAVMDEIDAVRFLINMGVDANVQNALLHTPLHLAAGMGHEKVIEVLVKQGNANKDILDSRNHAPIHYAVNNKRLEAVKLLLDLGASSNTVGSGKGSMKLSPVHVAVSSSNYDERNLCLSIVKCLINASNSEINLQDYENKTPLHYADRLKTIEILLTREDIDPLIKDEDGKTPFCYAKEANRLDIAKVLASNKYGKEKESLLHLAARKGYAELIDSILDEGVEIDALNESGESAIYLAAKNGHTNAVKLLLKEGADATDVFQYAIIMNDIKLIKLLSKKKDIVLFGKQDNFPTFHVLSNKYLEERRIADNRIRTCESAIYVFVTVCAVAFVVVYPNIGFAVVVGIVALTVAIVTSGLVGGYIEEKFQRKMSIELESEKTSESASTISSDIETQELQARGMGELEIDELEELAESRGRK